MNRYVKGMVLKRQKRGARSYEPRCNYKLGLTQETFFMISSVAYFVPRTVE
jgi:hypothetical protein